MNASIIYSCKNEISNQQFSRNLQIFKKLQDRCELVFVDGGSSDETVDRLSELKCKVYSLPHSNRAERYNLGAREASGELFLFHHPRSTLESGFLDSLEKIESMSWGAFTHSFDKSGLGYAFTSWYSNHIRGDLNSIYYLDHCLFVTADLFRLVNGFPNVDIFEDSLICEALRKRIKPIRLKETSTTSSIRFETNGFLKQAFMNQKLKIQYYLRKDLRKMNLSYEENLDLNGTKGKENEPTT